jgi:hypothetical protein
VSKRIDDGTKVGDTRRKHKHHSPFFPIRLNFDSGVVRRKYRNLLLKAVFAAQNGRAAIRPWFLGAFPGSLDRKLTRL